MQEYKQKLRQLNPQQLLVKQEEENYLDIIEEKLNKVGEPSESSYNNLSAIEIPPQEPN
jgi:hypothetical protein